MADTEQWYWDLRREVAVRASERGPGDQVLGPYDSRVEAENWRHRVEERNTAWEEADAEWRDGRDVDDGADDDGGHDGDGREPGR